MNDIATVEDRIASKIDTKVAGQLVVSDKAGGMTFTNAGEVMEFAKMLSISQGAVPKHLRGNPGACLGIVMQAIEWRMSPFAVANKSYVVNDRLAYEAQLIHAVALQRAPIKGRIKFEFTGEGATRKCRAWASIDDGADPIAEIVEYTSPSVGEIKVKNSQLWVSDPDQQLTYYSVRALCRRHFPDVLMGIYAPDEFDEPRGLAGNVGPPHYPYSPKPTLTEKLDAIASGLASSIHYPNSGTAQYNGPGAEGLGVWKEPTYELNVPQVPTPLRSAEENDKLALLVADAMKQSEGGSKHFTHWLSALSLPDYERLGKSLPELNKAAATADRRRAAREEP